MILQKLSNCSIISLMTLVVSGQIISEQCTNNLNNYIVNNLKPHQTVLLANLNFESIVQTAIVTIVKNLAYIQIDVEKMSSNDLKQSVKSPVFFSLRKTSLFLLTHSFTNETHTNNFSTSINYLTNLSPGQARPNVILITQTERKSSFKILLREMWKIRYLDFTILEINVKNLKGSLKSSDNIDEVAFIHYYNPFTERYSHKKCSLKTVWFPNKLSNLNGYQVTGGLIFYPPHSVPMYDELGQLNSYSGADMDMFNALSEAMNFSPFIDSNINSTLGIFNGNKATGMLGSLISNEVNILISTTINIRPSTEGGLYGYSGTIDMDPLVALLPIIHNNTEEQFLSLKKLAQRILLFIIVSIGLWTIMSVIRKVNSWKPEYIAATVLGVAIPKQPNDNFTRTLFLFLIAIGFYLSSTFLGSLTASKIKNTDDVKMETFMDLAKSDLTPISGTNIDRYLNDGSEALEILSKKIIPNDYVYSDCIAMLAKDKNVSCIIFNSYAKQLVDILKDKSGHPVSTILDDKFFNTRRVLVLERSSPYKERLDELISLFVASGLRMKWERNISHDIIITNWFGVNKFNDKTLLNTKDLGSVSNLGKLLLYTALSGYVVSFFVLVVEMTFYRFKLKETVISLENGDEARGNKMFVTSHDIDDLFDDDVSVLEMK